MARKSVTYVVTDEGRDKGKKFLITEMSAEQCEEWAMRVLLAVMGSNPELPPGFETLGMAALAEIGLRMIASLKWDQAKPLLDEMFSCVEILPDAKHLNVRRALIPVDIEEVSTRLKLRLEVWNLHMGFLKAALPSLSNLAKEAAGKSNRIGVSQK